MNFVPSTYRTVGTPAPVIDRSAEAEPGQLITADAALAQPYEIKGHVHRQPGDISPAQAEADWQARKAEARAAQPPIPEPVELLPPTSDRALLRELSEAITAGDREIIGRRADLEAITGRAEIIELALAEHLTSKPAPASGETATLAAEIAAAPGLAKGGTWNARLAKADAAHQVATEAWKSQAAALEGALDIVRDESADALDRLQTAIANRENAEARFAADASTILSTEFLEIIEGLQQRLLLPLIALRQMTGRHHGGKATLHLLRLHEDTKIQFIGKTEGGHGIRTAYPDPRSRLPWQEVVAQFRAAIEAEASE
jgi:hypothetical protein